MKFLKRLLGRLGSDRIVWRIAGTIILAILCTQVATVLLLRGTRPHEMPLYSISTLTSELRRHVGGEASQANDIMAAIPDAEPPDLDGLFQPFPFRDVQRRLQQALEPTGIGQVVVHVEWPRQPGRLLLWPLPIPRIAVAMGPEPPGGEGGRPTQRLLIGPREAGGPGIFPPPPPDFNGHRFGPPPGWPNGGPHGIHLDEEFLVPGIFTIWLRRTDNEAWQAYRPKVTFEPISPLAITLLWFLLIIGIIAGLAFWSTWRMLRPFKLLVATARDWRAEQEPVPLPEKGPLEFRTIATAFNDMQGKINRFVRDRTELVIALSHDLRTPLTRLQLRAEYVDDPEQRQRMLDELHFMEMLTDQLLSFASFNPRSEPLEKVDFAVLLVTLCDDRTDAGAVIEYSGPAHLAISCRPTAMRRALVNLIDNAVKYSDYAYLSLIRETDGARIFIRDSGPGIPEDELENVFLPFYRVDASRSRETGGLGMGLSVARAIVLEHQGSIALRNRQPHGLEVELFLPFGQT
jgi:signal transduction histidine kinase